MARAAQEHRSNLMHLGRNDEAISAYREALAADPAFAIGYVNLALCLSRAKRRGVATLAAFTRTVPGTANACYRGFIAQHLNLTEQAAAYRRALELDPRKDAQRALAVADGRPVRRW
jgi:tetratricopeptide (TPR) repeat protein